MLGVVENNAGYGAYPGDVGTSIYLIKRIIPRVDTQQSQRPLPSPKSITQLLNCWVFLLSYF